MRRKIIWLFFGMTLAFWMGCESTQENQNYKINHEGDRLFEERSPTQGGAFIRRKPESGAVARARRLANDEPIEAPTIDDPQDPLTRLVQPARPGVEPLEGPTLDHRVGESPFRKSPEDAPLRTDMMVFIDADGKVYVNQALMTIPRMQTTIRQAIKETPNLYVSLQADRSLSPDAIRPVVDAMRDAGVNLVTLLALDEGKAVAGVDRRDWPIIDVYAVDGRVVHRPKYYGSDLKGRAWVVRDARPSALRAHPGAVDEEAAFAVDLEQIGYNPRELLNLPLETGKFALDTIFLPFRMFQNPPWGDEEGKINNDLRSIVDDVE